jgi:cytochrome c biogenesis protein CcmG/thiol:disulfide interchange protein DsbE
MFRKYLVLSILVVALLIGCTARNETSAAASDFKLQDLNGKIVKLSDFKGKAVLVDFWATWCPPCRESIPGIEKLYKTYGGKGLVVLGISLDEGDWDSVKAFAAERGITYPVLKGTEAVASQFQVRTIPMLVIINKEGKIVKRYLGFGDDYELDKDIKAVL